jgi:polysaccharide export outer membrane protein
MSTDTSHGPSSKNLTTALPERAPGSVAGRLVTGSGLVLAALASLFVSGCESPGSGRPVQVSNVATGPVVLGEGDIVRLFFPGATEYNTTQKIRTDGKISLPLVGEVQAAGKTLIRLQSDLVARYKKAELQNAEVVVSLEASGKPVIISGAVASPGKILLERPTTLLEAIMGAGGFRDFAKKRQVRLIRVVNGQYHTEVYDMSHSTDGGTTPFVQLQGGDIIEVPLSNW